MSVSIVVVALALLGASWVVASDADVAERVSGRIGRAGIGGDVRVAVDKGVVVLEGSVPTVAARRQADRLAREEARVVENRLRVSPERRSDADIVKDVRHEVLAYPYYTVFDAIGFEVRRGVVTLVGSVQQPWRKREIDDRVARIAGVREVRNGVEVQPVSPFDDALRLQLYRRIYGGPDAILATRVSFVNPPVRIVVDSGRVTLVGFVPTALDQTLLGMAARQTPAFGVTNEVRVDLPAGKKSPAGQATEWI
jgi:osmotically-inducible protein OsmY